MRRPVDIERLYLDFDGFFASVHQQVDSKLRGKPIGVVPRDDTPFTCVIACSAEAKLRGVKNVMNVAEARKLCPDIVFVPQAPDLYRRAHNTLLSEISAVIPLDAVKSIDELTCRVSAVERTDPQTLGQKLKKRIADNVGHFIKCSIGFAANRQLAKMACKAGKPDGNMVWHPHDMPGPLLKFSLRDIPGIGERMELKLSRSKIATIADLLAVEPKHLRKIWGNVSGKRLWYALQGFDVQTPPSGRGMYGHGRVLPPDQRTLDQAKSASRLLIVKAARRMRRDGWNAGRVALWLELRDSHSWSGSRWLPAVHDDQAVLTALESVWAEAHAELPIRTKVIQVGVTLLDLTKSTERQLDILLNDDGIRKRWENATAAIDKLNQKYGKTLVSTGEWSPPPGGYAGGKISFTRIPRPEDFW